MRLLKKEQLIGFFCVVLSSIAIAGEKSPFMEEYEEILNDYTNQRISDKEVTKRIKWSGHTKMTSFLSRKRASWKTSIIRIRKRINVFLKRILGACNY